MSCFLFLKQTKTLFFLCEAKLVTVFTKSGFLTILRSPSQFHNLLLYKSALILVLSLMPWPLELSTCFRVSKIICLPFFFHACCMFYSSPTSMNDLEEQAMAQAVSHWAPIPCGVCGGQSSTGTIFSLAIRLSPATIIPPELHKHSFFSCQRYIL